jgi:hypothetical protein
MGEYRGALTAGCRLHRCGILSGPGQGGHWIAGLGRIYINELPVPAPGRERTQVALRATGRKRVTQAEGK